MQYMHIDLNEVYVVLRTACRGEVFGVSWPALPSPSPEMHARSRHPKVGACGSCLMDITATSPLIAIVKCEYDRVKVQATRHSRRA